MHIISGCTKQRFESEANHLAYAEAQGYSYQFDAKLRELKSPYDHKVYAILEQPIDNEWCFWMDDDAFFMQMETPLEGFLKGVPKHTKCFSRRVQSTRQVVGLTSHQATSSSNEPNQSMTFLLAR